ncbi:hypothetical protein N7541_011420 [Penicillium brevicompactum]|uniref:Calcineurin-like phosphoesterase domain-containing protein n=1 Tax=Penicillium brevicompactum TaxID=5074 RepID=A0A9W9QQG2_PENBR|nr:hypothetical protein N7541_011420 [Penicillium brevicompactum]
MNNHLLPFPYNQTKPSTWLGRNVQSLCHYLSGAEEPTSQQSATAISTQHTQGNLPPIHIVCISDTHNSTPPLPPGDILIHAGDLTAHGTLAEMQAQLQWLSSQPHSHKILIAGNHDILLDESCDMKFLTRSEDGVAERKELDWNGIQYLQDEAVTLEIPIHGPEPQMRRVKIYGSPLTPEFGRWAFQYPPIRDVWTGRVPDDTDILVVHGPPALYGDCDGEKKPSGEVKVKGDGYLLREIRRVKPKMVICGHIHGAFGLVSIKHDGDQDTLDGLRMRWDDYNPLRALRHRLWSKVFARDLVHHQETLVVNAALAPGPGTNKPKSAIAIDLH